MSHRCTVNSAASASAYGSHSHDDHGVPWQNTRSGPEPARPQRTERPRHSNSSLSSTGAMLPEPPSLADSRNRGTIAG